MCKDALMKQAIGELSVSIFGTLSAQKSLNHIMFSWEYGKRKDNATDAIKCIHLDY